MTPSVASLQSIDRMARNPDALYASALQALHLSPEIQAILSPVGKIVFDAGYQIASNLAGQSIHELGSVMTGAATEIIGKPAMQAVEGAASSIASTIGEAMPLINIAVNMVMTIAGVGAANTALAEAYQAQKVRDFLMGANAPGSGPGGLVEPADLFAPLPSSYLVDPTSRLGGYAVSDGWSWFRPSQPVGACLVALTEDSVLWGDAPDLVQTFDQSNDSIGMQPVNPDNNLLHHPAALDILRAAYMNLYPEDNKVGIPAARRAIYRAIRLAIGSHSESDAHGQALHTLYMDMLVDDFDKGQLSGGWMIYALSNVYVPGVGIVPSDTLTENLPSEFQKYFFSAAPCTHDQFVALVTQIGAMAAAWKTQRSTVAAPPLMHLVLSLPLSAALRLAAKEKFGPGLVNVLHGFSGAVQVSLLLAAYRRSLVKPLLLPFLHNSALLAGFSK